ncbi:hypothetical protein CIHG_03670 [Coccidioides immitis H538.4]|uniref:Uncharacterized protein n=1 Tax=Coccidioides immitis H538.4 TaxID=396776 RepID=A0A0J8RKH2_COCIT|nr:hypothetical protein CIHG_03670 [Coccidioides immitis H538.4]
MFTPYSIYLYKGHQPPKLVNIDHPVAKAVAIPNPCVLLLNLSIIRAILILEEDHQGFVSVQAESHRVKVVEEVQSSLMESDSLQARFEAIFPKLVILCSGSSRDPCIDEEDRGALGLGMECLMGLERREQFIEASPRSVPIVSNSLGRDQRHGCSAPDTLVVAEPFWEAAAGYGLTFEGLMKPVALNSSPELRIHTEYGEAFQIYSFFPEIRRSQSLIDCASGWAVNADPGDLRSSSARGLGWLQSAAAPRRANWGCAGQRTQATFSRLWPGSTYICIMAVLLYAPWQRGRSRWMSLTPSTLLTHGRIRSKLVIATPRFSIRTGLVSWNTNPG